MDNANELLAKLIHGLCCVDGPGCRRWGNADRFSVMAEGHKTYYRDKAEAISRKLAPEIGPANVPLVCQVILEEML